MTVYKPLFSDAELRKYFAQDVVGGDFAGNGFEMVEHFTDVLGEQVRRESCVQTLAGPGECFGRMEQCFVMAGVGYDRSTVVQRVGVDAP